ncbi:MULTISPECIES: N-acetylglucosamine-specific PTS transporter subunit IIBC [unclassified Sphingomonas]|uniref:N-acetylglucosamine-specific PTS transporter subunit IIBC n=1 Tax=unclassified Sphingomonas TaxID=196159 RepID=UPI00226A55D3|nr:MULTISPECIES: N-acetylglucosamine-specific PTS transporter subunit IIBC [unclassified Sphingomonas]
MIVKFGSPMPLLQALGRALMLPIAVLPIAGLLLRLGQPDLLNIAFVSAAGEAIFAHLGLLFAVGVATGIARDGNGAAAMAGVVCYLVIDNAAQVFLVAPAGLVPPGSAAAVGQALLGAWKAAAIDKLQVPIGIAAGLVGGGFYNRFSTVKLPDYLAFFGGRRLVPILAGIAGLAVALPLGLTYGWISAGVDALSQGIVASGSWGLFAFGLLNRLLIVTGLHHILNNVAYFLVGDYHGQTGDLTRFFAGDPSAGVFMSGFFPVMMFGLPAACLAMYRSAAPDRRAAVGGLLLSLGLTSFLTGVTEPIEFSFMFLAPVLYVVHAVLTGTAEVVMNLLGVRLGYGFSAGLLDYVLNYGRATRPLLMLPVGALYALLYYGLFRWAIVRFDLPTPGREPLVAEAPLAPPVTAEGKAAAFVAALGGEANLRQVDACATRLRLTLADSGVIDEAALRALGARGVLRPSAKTAQVIVGGIADGLAMEMRAVLDQPEPVAATPAVAIAAPAGTLPRSIGMAVGGWGNIRSATRHAGRWRILVEDPERIDDIRLAACGIRALARPAPAIIHLLLQNEEV